MLGQGVPHPNSGIFDIETVGKLGVAVIAHKQGVIRCEGVEIFIPQRRPVNEPHGGQTFSFWFRRVELDSKPADAHQRTSKNSLNMSAAQPHRDERGGSDPLELAQQADGVTKVRTETGPDAGGRQR